MGWQADEESYELTLPWDFPFYDNNYRSVWVCTNGFIDFTSSATDYSNSTTELIESVRIAPLWDDLTMEDGDIYVDTTAPEAVTIRWQGHLYGSDGENPVDFMVTLSRDGIIRFDYGAAHSGLSPTIGISAGDGTRYTLSSRDEASEISDNVASLFAMSGGSFPPVWSG